MRALLDALPRARLRAIRELPASPALGFSLRRVLFTDHHAEVRAAAARRLGRLAARDAADWLVDALGDRSALVRDAILRALARCGGPAARDPVRERLACDRVWWVRRTAIYALAVIAAADELAAFEAALGDPFWRVRHAAVRVLAALGARDLEVRAQIQGSAAPAETRAFLRAAWGPAVVEPAERGAAASQLPAELLDRDPAVVTARLAHRTVDAAPVALVELLCDPHAPLRILAAQRVAASGDLAAYEAALDWLEEPRIPHVADTVERLLDGLGDPSAVVAGRALARSDRLGAARWAIGWVVATRYRELAGAALDRARADARLREPALALATIDDLVAWARDGLVDPVAGELHARRSPAAHRALLGLATAAHPRARALQIDAAARAGEWSLVETALGDPHHGPRAVATQAWRRAGREVAAALTDADPAVREAALAATDAARFLEDPDPWVARAAAHLVATGRPVDDAALARVLALLADRDEAVRSAALDALGRVADLEARMAALVDPPEPARRILRAWLHGEVEPPPAIAPPAIAPREPRVLAAAATVVRRPFGRAGFDVAPLAMSGAYGLSPSALARAADAGVDLWFWEPTYARMTPFLRRRREARVIAGSYHAEPQAIEADVDRARRLLGRDALDVFLLFWTRSPARVDGDAFAALDRLRRGGKVRAVGFSTHDRALARAAIEAHPWDVVMTRHSAAHPGIEDELLPAARAHGTAILTFAALCYGRMTSGPGAPSDADCIRYSLSQPGVTACINAPRRRAEVESRVAVLARPMLPTDELAALRAHGASVRVESQRLNALLRQPTRDAAAAARALLAGELPPRDELEQRPLPRPRRTRPARTLLGKTRRGGV